MRLSLYYPVKPFHVNQGFGANLPCVANFGQPDQIIVTGANNFTCPVGFDKLYQHWGMAGHNGTDLQAGEQNIYAACAGTVIEKQVIPSRGLGLGILTNEAMDIDENGTFFMRIRYWHLKSFAVEVGEHVNVGTVLGISNNTGYSSGNHLHFEGGPMVKDAGGHVKETFVQGNIVGAIDIEPYFIGQYAQDAVVPPKPPFRHFFAYDMQFGDRRNDVVALQDALKIDSVFPKNIISTGYYGYITKESIRQFQLKHQIQPAVGICGPRTREVLNTLFNTT